MRGFTNEQVAGAGRRIRTGSMQHVFACTCGDDAGSIPTFPPRPLTLLYTTFQDHAVLQRDKPIPVWGLTKPGANVTVHFAGETASAEADETGQWKLTLPAMKAGGPYEMSAASSAGQTQTIKDVLLGDVYLCSGQSNMEYPVRIVGGYDADVKGASNRAIRLFHVQRFSSATPRDELRRGCILEHDQSRTQSRNSRPPAISSAAELQPAVNVPLGLIEDSWGGSALQTWLSTEADSAARRLRAATRDHGRIRAQSGRLEATLARFHERVVAGQRSGTSATPTWSDPGFDDSGWPEIILAGDWEGWGIPALSAFDGIVWVRKSFTLTAEQAKGAATLSLGPVDDIDTTWVNGKQVGGEEGWDTPRIYSIPAGTLHEGTNVIAVGVLDTGAGGGIWGTADEKTVKFANGIVLKLNTPWKYKISVPLAQTKPMPHAPWLKESGLSMLYNGMIAPLGPTQIRGVVWYQGESDAAQAKEYARLLPALMEDWRHRFGADVSFLSCSFRATDRSPPSPFSPTGRSCAKRNGAPSRRRRMPPLSSPKTSASATTYIPPTSRRLAGAWRSSRASWPMARTSSPKARRHFQQCTTATSWRSPSITLQRACWPMKRTGPSASNCATPPSAAAMRMRF